MNSKRIRGVFSWFGLFIWVLRNRGRQTYGRAQIRRQIERLIVESKAKSKDINFATKLLKEMQELFSNQNVNQYKTIRFGGGHDGGYPMPTGISIESAICAGIGKTSEFERDLSKLNIEVLALDPTVLDLPHPHANIKHEKLWLRGSTLSRKNSISIAEVLLRFSPSSKKLIKMDIEGDEIEVILSLATCDNLESVELMIIEFHDVWKILDPQTCKKWMQAVTFIRQNFACISFHSNNWTNFFNIGNVFCPETFEAVLVNKHSIFLLENEVNTDEWPVNNQNKADIPHGIFEVDLRLGR
jgi:hypothetical protein